MFFVVLLTSFLSIGAIFVITKIMGHKQLSQLDFFDYVSGITIGSIAAELATELEKPQYPLIALFVYGFISVILNKITHVFTKSRKYINGTPTVIMQNDKIYRENMKKANLDLSEFMLLCREKGYFDLSEIDVAIFEYNGKVSILPKQASRPLAPSDVGLSPKEKGIDTEIIMDGQVITENLKRRGLDKAWLDKSLREQGYKNEKQVFLCLADKDNKIKVYPMEARL